MPPLGRRKTGGSSGVDSRMISKDCENQVANQFSRPFPIKLINEIGGALSKIGLYTIKLDKQSLLSSAKRRSNLDDIEDSRFELPFNKLIKSINEDAKLDYFGRFMVREMLTNDLINRLRISSVTQQHPDITEIPIIRPIFVLGFPRTGTTLLHNLLALDPNSRSPKMWEALNPAPSATQNGRQTQTLIKEAEKFVKAANYLVPQLASIHALNATGPDECLKLIENTFISPHFYLFFNVPSYWKWLLHTKHEDFVEVYKYHRKQLQILNWYESGTRWVLKTPVHLFFLKALSEVYPDACIIHLHRDPQVAIPSFCSLVAANRGIFNGPQDMDQLGKLSTEIFEEMNDRAIADRETAKPGQFFDVSYSDLVNNPANTVRKIYDYFSLDYSDAHDTRVKKWLSDNPINKHGLHDYSLDQFGLSFENINQAAKAYLERFKDYC
jgi:Sulfotransferase family